MSFFETPRFPDDIANGSRGGPGYSTDIVILNSGYEQRNANWSMARCRYDVAHGVKNQSDIDTLIKFFRVCKGRAHGFRFKDHSDYSVSGSDGVLTSLTATTWQMKKRYSNAGGSEDRTISKPVSGTITVAGGGTYTIDYTTGIITKTAGADPTSWTGEFDVPCRFDSDVMDVSIDSKGLYTWGSVIIVEIRV